MYYNYKLDEQTTTNILKSHIKPIEKQKQIKLTIPYTKSKTSTSLLRITPTPLKYS